jgi:hypothetical protein
VCVRYALFVSLACVVRLVACGVCGDRDRGCADIFRPSRGFECLRFLPRESSRRHITCTVEFQTAFDAFEAMNRLQHYGVDKSNMEETRLHISFARSRR